MRPSPSRLGGAAVGPEGVFRCRRGSPIASFDGLRPGHRRAPP